MTHKTITWQLGLTGTEVKEGTKRLSKLHVELDRWHKANGFKQRIFNLQITRPYTYEAVIDTTDPKIELFLNTFLLTAGSQYTLTTVGQ